MHEGSGEEDAGAEVLCDEEDAGGDSEGRDLFSQDGEAASDDGGQEDYDLWVR